MIKDELVQKAKENIPIEEYQEEYYSLLFMNLLNLKCPVTDAVRVVNKEIRGSGLSVKYEHLFSDSVQPNTQPVVQEFLSELKTLPQQPKGNLGNMIWLTSLFSRPADSNEFLLNVDKIRKAICKSNKG